MQTVAEKAFRSCKSMLTWISSSSWSAVGKASVSCAQPVLLLTGRPAAAILSTSAVTAVLISSAILIRRRSSTYGKKAGL